MAGFDPVTGQDLALPKWGWDSNTRAQQPYWYPSSNRGSFNTDIYGGAQLQPNPLFFNAGQGGFSSGGFGGGSNQGGSRGQFGSNNNMSSFTDLYNSITGGGNVNFGGNTPEGMNPYQFMPAVQNLQRSDRFVLPLTDEEEFLRQYGLGNLLGDRPGEQLATSELMKTVGGQYLSPESNPFLAAAFKALGREATDRLNEDVNSILARAGTSGALGGSRSALMQGQAAGETGRAFNQTVADWLNQNYARERGLQLQSIPGLLGAEQLPMERINQAMQLAGMPRGIEQQELSSRINEWMRQQNERYLPVQVAQSIGGQRIGQTIPIVNQGSPLSGLGNLITGASNALGQYGGSLGNLASSAWGGINSLANMFGGANPYASGMSSFGGLVPEMSQPSDLGGLFEFGPSGGMGGF